MASNGKRMVKEDLIKKLERISENPTYEILSFKNESSNIDLGYISESDPNVFGAKLERYDTFTLREHHSGSGYEENTVVVNIPNADALYPNNQLRQTFYTALGAKVGDTTVYANNKGIIELPNSGVEKKLYYATIYMAELDSGVSFLTDNDYGLCANHPEIPGSKPFWQNDLYEAGDLYSDLTADEKTKIANILLHLPTEPYDTKIGGIVTNYTNNTIILSGTFKSYGEISLFYLTDNNGSLSMTTEDISIVDGAALRTQLDTNKDIKFSIIQIL